MDQSRSDKPEGAPACARNADAGAPSGGAGPERRFSALYRPRMLRHLVAAYAARAAVESRSWRTAPGGRNPCRSISHVAL